LKEEALARNMWRTRLGRGYSPAVRQTVDVDAVQKWLFAAIQILLNLLLCLV